MLLRLCSDGEILDTGDAVPSGGMLHYHRAGVSPAPDTTAE